MQLSNILKEVTTKQALQQNFQEYGVKLPPTFKLSDMSTAIGLPTGKLSILLANLVDKDVMQDIANNDYTSFDPFDNNQFNEDYDDLYNDLKLGSLDYKGVELKPDKKAAKELDQIFKSLGTIYSDELGTSKGRKIPWYGPLGFGSIISPTKVRISLFAYDHSAAKMKSAFAKLKANQAKLISFFKSKQVKSVSILYVPGVQLTIATPNASNQEIGFVQTHGTVLKLY